MLRADVAFDSNNFVLSRGPLPLQPDLEVVAEDERTHQSSWVSFMVTGSPW
ncbi:hypothetical protein [Rubidibacter lacunae]|uniref:hypothetical protein n=1 Tax=Rubidibacter lacunae TaxID=582514 RepID=UPI0004254701|nr:hypothetical protein [Rubidibacter lacunae]